MREPEIPAGKFWEASENIGCDLWCNVTPQITADIFIIFLLF